jgi:hypothetical protein
MFSKKKKGIQPKCKPCAAGESKEWYHANKEKANATRLKTTYGISMDEYAGMFEAQDGRCKICNTKFNMTRFSGASAAVDHCHTTGAVRGLLCNSCNRGVGYFRDNPEFLRAAAKYLEEQ